MTRADLAQLWALQAHDLKLERALAERDALDTALATDRAAAARAALAREQRRAQARAAQQREVETTLDVTTTRLRQQEGRLFGGAVGAKDLGKLQHEIEHLQALRAEQEEAVLGAMAASEAAEVAVRALRDGLAAAEGEQERERVGLRERLAQAPAQLARLRAERDALAATCAPKLAARYNALRRSHGGRALAEVHNGVCQACRVTISDNVLRRARTGAELVPCNNCGRILYIP